MQRYMVQLQNRSHTAKDAIALLDPQRSVARKRSAGSTNPRQVARALTRWSRRLR